VIGALGGSGTRVAAQALIDAGAYLGGNLNQARDNLVFTEMFKHPDWLAQAGDEQVHRRLDEFAALMREQAGAAPAWGWKEPNSHVLLPHLIDHFPGLRYVYVARHGLDMAYSRNQTQLRIWGPRFGVVAPDDAPAPGAQVDFWIAATRRAVELGQERLGERFLFLRFEDLCRAPEVQIRRLLEFAGLVHDDALVGRLAAEVEAPASIGRWRRRAGTFTPAQIEAVGSFGFDVERRPA
jgi:hypothetical protein